MYNPEENELLHELDEVRQELRRTKKALEVYKKALEYIDKVLFDHCCYSLECYVRCEHKFDNCDCLKLGMWAELALEKAGEEE